MCLHYVVGKELANLLCSVGICLCCNQMFSYWKMSLLAGNVQWCHTILEVKNSLVTTTQQQQYWRWKLFAVHINCWQLIQLSRLNPNCTHSREKSKHTKKQNAHTVVSWASAYGCSQLNCKCWGWAATQRSCLDCPTIPMQVPTSYPKLFDSLYSIDLHRYFACGWFCFLFQMRPAWQ